MYQQKTYKDSCVCFFMKNLLGKLAPPFLMISSLFSPLSASAETALEEKAQANDTKSTWTFGAGMGAFEFSNKNAKDMYGRMPFFRVNLGNNFSNNFRVEGGISYMRSEGEGIMLSEGDVDLESYVAELEMSVFSYDFGVKYLFKGEKRNFFVGGGLKKVDITEALALYKKEGLGPKELLASGEVEYGSIIPFISVGGEMFIDQKKTFSGYLELCLSSGEADTDIGSAEIGGSSLEVGIRKFFR